MNKEELLKQVTELKELKAMAEELQAEINSIEDNIKAEMTQQNVSELKVGVFKIRWVPVSSTRFDSVSFKKVYADLYAQFSKVIESKRFTVA